MKVIAIILLTVSAAAAEFTCTPGASFKIDCNTCACSEDGKSAACTRMACPSEVNANVNDIDTIQTRMFCVPRSVFKPDSCNICKCNEDGTNAACTFKLCPKKNTETIKEHICVPNSVYKPDSCNVCKCNADGTQAACTYQMCPDVDAEPKQVCKPNVQFYDYCNTCTCSDDGLLFVCTQMYCDKSLWNKDGSLKNVPKEQTLIKKTEKQICVPNTHFEEQCNTCVCSNDGLSKACTMMECDGKDNTKQVCEPGKEYSPDGCNTCICNEYGTQSACTYKLCLPSLRNAYSDKVWENWGPAYHQGDACTPGKSFYSECNRCVCLGNGRNAFCTVMACTADNP